MGSVERNLLMKNRDRFTQNLSFFRRDINDLVMNTTQFQSHATSAGGGGGGGGGASSMNDMIVS